MLKNSYCLFSQCLLDKVEEIGEIGEDGLLGVGRRIKTNSSRDGWLWWRGLGSNLLGSDSCLIASLAARETKAFRIPSCQFSLLMGVFVPSSLATDEICSYSRWMFYSSWMINFIWLQH